MPAVSPTPCRSRAAVAAVIASMVMAASCAPASAQQSSAQDKLSQEQKDACTADFKRLCPGTLPGGGRIKACFAEHYEELSEQCQMAVNANASGGVGQ